MDQLSSRRRKGFMGAKGSKQVMKPFYRSNTSKPTSTFTTINNNNNRSSLVPPTHPHKHLHHQDHARVTATAGPVEFIVKQDQVSSPQPKQMSVSILLPESNMGAASRVHVIDYGGVAVDESVDIKASTYISSVRERIMLQVQTINS